MNTYLALLRGINVGGNSLIKMETLRSALSAQFPGVTTYIQSGNVIFKSDESDTVLLARSIEATIQKEFNLTVSTVVWESEQWKAMLSAAPDWWGIEPSWKHNLLVMVEPTPAADVLQAIGELKPDIEKVTAGESVFYQSLSFEKFGRTSSGKLASLPVYKKMTIRNYNIATKLASLL